LTADPVPGAGVLNSTIQQVQTPIQENLAIDTIPPPIRQEPLKESAASQLKRKRDEEDQDIPNKKHKY
jgi:hypothetical protein